MMSRVCVAGLMGAILFLVGCASTPTPAAAPTLSADYSPLISATGKVLPEVWATVGAQTGGMAMAIPATVGMSVAAGDVLARFDDADARLAVAQAEATLAAAQAQLARLQAPPRAEEIAVLEAQRAATQASLAQSVALQEQLTRGGTAAAVAAAAAQVARAEAEAWAAKDVYDQLGWQLGDAATTQWHAAQAALTAAQAQLVEAQQGGAAQVRAASAGVQAATAQQQIIEAQLALLKAGATPEEIAVTQAGVQQAEATLAAAQLALARTELRAPFGGVVGAVFARPGEFVAPGQPLVTLGDLSTLRVETTDLDEIDVARVVVGQPAIVTFDALPGRVFDGRVTRIAPMAEPGAGGVHYTVIIALDALDPAVRWGMTAFVDIETAGK